MIKKIALLAVAGGLFQSSASYADNFTAPVDFWANNGWTQFANDDGHQDNGFVDPGYGGQAFDAEYLYYKVEGTTVSIGLQTGFDIDDGVQTHGGKLYYAGDLALSVDGQVNTGAGAGTTYEYGIDFGLYTEGYSNGKVDAGDDTTGIDAAGLYEVTTWNNDVVPGHHVADPFAIDEGNKILDLTANDVGFDGTLESYYRTVSFDVAGLGWGDEFVLDAHWTMSCGNDEINGNQSITVPEPTTLPLLGLGLVGLFAGRRRKKTA